jgi:hypothetical protein
MERGLLMSARTAALGAYGVVRVGGRALGGRVLYARAVLMFAVAVGMVIAAPVTASAASAPFQIGSYPVVPGQLEIPSIDVDANGTAYAAWADLTNNVIHYCVLPDGATACMGGVGTLTPVFEPGANPKAELPTPSLSPFGHVVEVLVNGSTVSIVAGATGPADEGEPTTGGSLQEVEMWQAPDGTGNFQLVNNGNSIAYPETRTPDPNPPYTNMVDASFFDDGVVVPGSGELGVFDFTPDGPPSFEAFPKTDPPACSELSHPACAFATLEPSSNPDPVSNYSFLVDRQIASESGTNPGILGVDLTQPYATGPLACAASGTVGVATDAYMYGSGLQSSTNNYNISPGQPDSAWKVAATEIPGECPAGVGAIAGGPSGFGLFQEGVSSKTSALQYRPFDAATAAFDEPTVTVDPNTSAATLGLSQDGAGNIYATGFVQQQAAGGPTAAATAGAPLALFYSSDGGKHWKGPGSLEATVQSGFQRSESAVGADGKGWMVITAAGSLYALEFSPADAGNSFSARLSTPRPVTNNSVTVPLSCYSVPCTVSTQLSAVVARVAHAKRKRVALVGSDTVKITKHGIRKVKIHLTVAGRAALKRSHGKLAVSLTEATAVGPFREDKTGRLKLTEKRLKKTR